MKKILAIIPAHNEAANLPILIKGLKAQTYPLDICIVSDNSTDNTVEVAKERRATIVTETVGNIGMRAGAINWGINHFFFPGGYDYVLAMDADSTCADNIIEEGVKALEEDPKLGAVCTRCGVLPQPELKTFQEKLLWHLQHLEYGEYDSSRVETTGKIKVAHGLATMFRKEALDGQRKKHGHVYNNESLCEDYWLTMDLKEQGWKITSNQKMKAWTIVPTKLRSTKTDCGLWNQRKRWNLGGIDTIRAHGLSKITMWDIYAHVMSVSLLVAEAIVIGTAIYLMARGEPLYLSWLFYIVLGAMWINGMYRLRYCQNPDKWDILLRITAVPMEIYYHFLMATLLGAYWQYLKGAKRSY